MLTHFLGHQSSGFCFTTSLSGKPKTHRPTSNLGKKNSFLQVSIKTLSKLERKILAKIEFKVFIDCAAEDCSATLVEMADEPEIRPLVSSLPSVTILLCETNRRLTDCSFPRLLIHFLQGFTYYNKGGFMSFRQLAKLNSAIRRIPFLVLFSLICSILRLSVHASTKTSNT
ncbi:hypothetical protein H5410_036109 [Solanum commersonii]|uniref:Uncharacterized protein n=1 Tax=Solanum commersonii TaxID=4109 RepID=A0A9J5Y3T5_SOLCO|nr:hypothetical protein H5410_036109 [Solanum commersonii]